MKLSRPSSATLAAGIAALALSPALAPAPAHAEPSAAAVSQAQRASSPTGTVKAFLESVSAKQGKTACAQLTKGYQKKFVRSAVKIELVPAGSSCVEVAEAYGAVFANNGGLPKYSLKVLKRTERSAKVQITYKGDDPAGSFGLTRVGSKWLISDGAGNA